jgi:hypothetical protein
MQSTPTDPKWYSNPGNNKFLPFPLLYTRLPTDRFRLKPSKELPSTSVFEFMGRESFSRLWESVGSMQLGVGFSQLFLHGSIGYGKSHILAALVCFLAGIGKRTVYLPDCRQLLAKPLPYIQSALLCTFSDPSSSSERDKIRRFTTTDDALAFCHDLNGTHLYFITDQINAFEREGPNKDKIPDDDKIVLRRLLEAMFLGHFSITSASANYRTAFHMRQKQDGELKLTMMGGMSEVGVAHSSFLSSSFHPTGGNESMVATSSF